MAPSSFPVRFPKKKLRSISPSPCLQFGVGAEPAPVRSSFDSGLCFVTARKLSTASFGSIPSRPPNAYYDGA